LDGTEWYEGRIKSIQAESRALAEDWKRYAMTGRRGNETAKMRMAVKHGICLLGFNHPLQVGQLKIDLAYCLKEVASINLNEEIRKRVEREICVDIPVLAVNLADYQEGGVVGFRTGEKIEPRHLKRVNETLIQLESIANCYSCPASGRCNITSTCVSYQNFFYDEKRREFTRQIESAVKIKAKSMPIDPTPEEYAEFIRLKPSRKK